MRRTCRSLAAIVAIALPLSAAHADSIDGDWCAPEGGKSLSIQGSTIRTPGGKEIRGSYGRHDFHYVAPDGDPTPGIAIDLRLMGENAVRVTPQGGATTVWRRCPPGTV